MATSNSTLDIRIRALVEGLEQLRQLTGELGNTGTAARQAGQSSSAAGQGFDDLEEGARKGSGGVKSSAKELAGLKDGADQLAGALKKAALAFVAFLAVKGIKELADTAARTETLGVTLNVVGRNAGYSTEQLAAYEKELRKTGISTSAARESLTKMIQAGLNLNSVNAQGVSMARELARASQDLAVVTGENSSETLRRLIINIQQMDTVGLRFQGLTVNIEAAQTKFAASLGKTSDQLTQQQKIQSVANAALAEAAKLSGAYEAALETVGKKLGSLTRYQEDAANSLGKSLLPAYTVIVDAATDVLKKLSEVADEVARQGEVAEGLKGITEAIVNPLSDLFTTIIDSAQDLAPVILLVAEQMGDLVGGIFSASAAIAELVLNSDSLKNSLQLVGLLFAGVQDGLTVLSTSLAAVGLIFLRLGEYAASAAAEVADFFGFDNAAQTAREASAAIQEQADATEEAIRRNIESFSSGDSAVQRYATSLEEGAQRLAEGAKNATKAYKETDDAITALKSKVSQNTVTSVEAADAVKELQASVDALGASGDLTSKQVAELGQRLKLIAQEDATKVTEAMGKMGLSMQAIGELQFLGPLNKQFGEALGALQELATNASSTGAIFSQAFSQGVDTAKSVADVGKLAAVLKDAENAGKDVTSQTVLLGQQFKKVFEGELSTATTREELDLLKEKVEAVAKTYPELASQATQALKEVERAVKSAGQSDLDLAKQSLDVTKAKSSVLTSQLAVRASEATVQTKLNSLADAQKAVLTNNTALTRAKFELAQGEYNLSQAQLTLAQQQATLESQALDVLITKQKALNAEKQAGNGTLSQEEADLAAQRAEAEEVIYARQQEQLETQKNAVETQTQQVDELRQAVSEQERLNAAAEKGANQSERGTEATKKTNEVFNSLLPTAKGMQGTLEGIGLSLVQAKEYSEQWYRSIGQGGVGSSFDQVWEGIRLMEKNLKEATESSQKMAEAAENVRARFEEAKAEAAGVGDEVKNVLPGMASGTAGARSFAAAVRQVKEEAQAVSKAAIDSAKSFSASTRSIQEELLIASGREDEALKSKTESRKADLTVQYELLRVQLQIAIATAKAAGQDTTELTSTLNTVTSEYEKAQRTLTKLQDLELAKRRQKRAADAAQQQAELEETARVQQEAYLAERQAADEATQALISQSSASAKAATTTPTTEASTQSIAQSIAVGKQTQATTTTPTKVFQLDLTAGGSTVSATVKEDDEQTLLRILERGRRVV